MAVGAIIVAAGRGDRMASAVPKQLLDLGGRSLLQHSVAVFDRHPSIRQIVVVLPQELVAEGRRLVGETSRDCVFVAGGARRQDSVASGVAALAADVDTVLVHDAARPFADAALVTRVLAGVAQSGAAVPAVGVRDTVKRRDPATGHVAETLARDHVWLAQTPQGFRREILQAAIDAGADGAPATDDAMLAERAGHKVLIVPGDERNVKITTPEDLIRARAGVEIGARIGTGYDLHRLVPGRPLTLAGVAIPFERGPLGHSDGDVVCHALADALFGAAGAGDIGRHFPNTAPEWKDAPGLDLLGRAVAIVGESGWRVSNVDVTVVLERPKLAPFIDPIRAALAPVLGVSPDAVSVKAKTNEGVDAVGQGEAIAAQAIAMLTPSPGTPR